MRQAGAAAHTGLEHLQGAHQTVSRGVLVQCQQMARAFATQCPAVLGQFFQYVAVTHFGALQANATLFERHLHRHVGHQCAHDARHMFITPHAVGSHQIQQLIAVIEAPCRIHHLQAIRIAIQRYTVVSAIGTHRAHQSFGVCGAHLMVDVQAIRCAANGQHFCAQFMEYLGSHLVGCAVRCIHHDLEPTQGQVLRERAFTELNVAPCRIVQSTRFTQARRISPDRCLVQRGLNRLLPGIWQFRALGAEKLDAIVWIGVVACTDHHPQAGTLSPRQVCHPRRGQRPEQHHIDPSGVEP